MKYENVIEHPERVTRRNLLYPKDGHYP